MIRELPNCRIQVASDARIAENATLVGDIKIDSRASIWYGAVLRGDNGQISVGARSCVQDNAVVHSNTVIAEDVLIGHGAIVHGCTLERNCLIGMGATVLNGAVIGEDSMIAAGCLVPQGKVIPAGSLVMGVPGKIVATLTEEQARYVWESAAEYLELSERQLPTWEEMEMK